MKSDRVKAGWVLGLKEFVRWKGNHSLRPLVGPAAALVVSVLDRAVGVRIKNRPFFIVNGERDRLYPVSSMRPWLSGFDAVGVEYEFRPQSSGHDVSW